MNTKIYHLKFDRGLGLTLLKDTVLHTVLISGLFATRFMKNLPVIQEIWKNHWNVDSAHCLDKVNIWHIS